MSESARIKPEDLQQLPRRALAAFAARCARRVQPLFAGLQERAEAVDAAIDVAERYANGGRGDPYEAYNAAVAVGGPRTGGETDEAPAAPQEGPAEAPAVRETAGAAASAARTGSFYDPAVPTFAARAAERAAAAAAAVGAEAEAARASAADLQTLRALNLTPFPAEGPAIDPSASGPLGPLWAHGAPGWHRPGVPAYFQDEGEAALRSQVEWLGRHGRVEDRFFARFLRVEEDTFRAWRARRAALPSDREEGLRAFWRAVLHLLSFCGFDEQRLRLLLEQSLPASTGPASSLAPPWCGSSLREYLEDRGPAALEEVERWVTGFRFGDPYRAVPGEVPCPSIPS
jgi:hypothetical protein